MHQHLHPGIYTPRSHPMSFHPFVFGIIPKKTIARTRLSSIIVWSSGYIKGKVRSAGVQVLCVDYNLKGRTLTPSVAIYITHAGSKVAECFANSDSSSRSSSGSKWTLKIKDPIIIWDCGSIAMMDWYFGDSTRLAFS